VERLAQTLRQPLLGHPSELLEASRRRIRPAVAEFQTHPVAAVLLTTRRNGSSEAALLRCGGSINDSGHRLRWPLW